MSNPGSDDLKRVAELTNIIQMDHACNIQFTSGDICRIYSELNITRLARQALQYLFMFGFFMFH